MPHSFFFFFQFNIFFIRSFFQYYELFNQKPADNLSEIVEKGPMFSKEEYTILFKLLHRSDPNSTSQAISVNEEKLGDIMRHASLKDPSSVSICLYSFSTIYFVYNLALFFIFMRDLYKVYLTKKEKNKTFVKLNNLFLFC